MCLGTVAQVVRCLGDGHVELRTQLGIERALVVIHPCSFKPGDWVLVHTGLVYSELTEAQAHEAMEIRRQGMRAVS